jgi:hypothetical protein
MLKAIAGSLGVGCLFVGCAASPPAASPQAAAGQAATVATVDSAPANDDEDYETIFVPPPVGSLLGGGSVRVPKKHIAGTDETALLGNIGRLNAAAGSKDERRFVVAAVAQVTGVSPRELQAQQDVLQLRFGELCAINAIARGDSNKVQEIASFRAKGRSWTDLARANGVSIATVTKTAQNANDLTVATYSNAMDRAKGGEAKMKAIGVKVFPRPQTGPGGG